MATTNAATRQHRQTLLRIFEDDPSVKAAVNLGSDWCDALLSNDIFQKEASMFTEMMGYTVEHVDLLETTTGPYLMAVGASHVHMEGFKRTSKF